MKEEGLFGVTEEAKLIRQILSGRRDLFADLIAPHLAPLMRMVEATIGVHPDADDIVQKAVIKALTRLEQFRFEASFRTWLMRIGLNEARQWRRDCARRRMRIVADYTSEQLPVVDARPSPLAECQKTEIAARLRVALAWLPEAYRAVILLRDLEEFSISQVAQRLGLTPSAVKSRHFRARQKMATLLRSFNQPKPLRRAWQ